MLFLFLFLGLVLALVLVLVFLWGCVLLVVIFLGFGCFRKGRETFFYSSFCFLSYSFFFGVCMCVCVCVLSRVSQVSFFFSSFVRSIELVDRWLSDLAEDENGDG